MKNWRCVRASLRVAFRWNELAGSYRLSSALGLIGGAYQAWILPAVVADLFGVVHETPLGRRVLSNSIFSADYTCVDDTSVGWLASCLGGGSNRSVDSTYERRASGNTGILRNDPAWKATGFNLKRTANPGHLP